MNTKAFLITAGVLVLAWIANLPVETKIAGRRPTIVEVTLSALALLTALFGLFVGFRNWESIKTDDIYMWGTAALFSVVLGVLLQVFMSTLEAGRGFKDIEPFPLIIALLMAVAIFVGLWSSLEDRRSMQTLVVAVTAGYGWKGFYQQMKNVAERKHTKKVLEG